MPSHPDVPDLFDVRTLVLLRRPDDAPEMTDEELEDLQGRHLTYRGELGRSGVLVANGPCAVAQGDESYRGISIFACSPEEAARLSDGDPSVQAGRLVYDVLEWWVAADRIAFPHATGPVGVQRSMSD